MKRASSNGRRLGFASESHRYPKLSPSPTRFVSPRARETGHRVADFNTLDDLLQPPPGAKPIAVIRPRTVESPRRSAHHHPGRRK